MKERLVTLDVTDVTPEGYGVARDESGKVVFIPDTAPGDRVEAGIIKELKNSSVARLIGIIAPSRLRTEEDCGVCRRCGGCVFRHLNYEAELEAKRKFVSDAFARIGGIPTEVLPVVSGDPYGYRNKVQYPVAPDGFGKCAYGYYARRSHRIVEHEKCFIQSGFFDEIARSCTEAADEYGVSPYDETTGKGVLRHIVMRANRKGEIMLCLVAASLDGKLNAAVRRVYEKHAAVIGAHVNLNPRPGNVIFGDKTVCVCGEETLEDTLCGKRFALSPRAFYQVNAEMAEKLYTHARSLASGGNGVILDLYCGAGTVGLCVAGENDLLCGVEIIPEAVENAKENARMNGRGEENTLFVAGDAATGIKECEKRFGLPGTVIVDPPRKGLDRAVVDEIVGASPEKVVYISCDPATLARDCSIFAENGYRAAEAQPFDLFPRTGHVETVVRLSRSDMNS